MPRAAKICSKDGCPELVTGSNYCPEHALAPANNWHTSTRGSKTPPGWARIRQSILHRDRNTCQYCYGPANEVDHVIPVSRGGTHKRDNLVAACKKCNAEKNYRERFKP